MPSRAHYKRERIYASTRLRVYASLARYFRMMSVIFMRRLVLSRSASESLSWM